MSTDGTLVDVEGQVKWFDPRKGFGFVVGPDGQDIFVHFSTIEQQGFRTLRDGEKVVYSAKLGAKGWAASAVRHLEPVREPVREPAMARARGAAADTL